MNAAALAVLIASATGGVEEAQELFKAGDYAQAAVAASELDGADARLVVGKSLYRMGLLQAALAEFSGMLEGGSGTPQARKAIEWLVFISRKGKNPRSAQEQLARFQESELPERYRAEIALLLARYHLERALEQDRAGSRAEADASAVKARRLAQELPRESKEYATGRYVEALTWVRADELAPAVAALRQVLKLTAPGAQGADPQLRELAFLQLGRLAYGQKQFRPAAAYYRKLSAGSARWLDALFESAWASFRLGHDDRALGNLVTLASPFFKDQYYPEGYLLRALIYYENCRFPEAAAVVDDLEATYGPLHRRLSALLQEELAPAEAYDRFRDDAGAAQEGVVQRALRAALTDKELEALDATVVELEGELDALEAQPESFRYSALAKRLGEQLKANRQALRERAGAVVKKRLGVQSAELRTLLANGLRLRVEISGHEKEQLEVALRTGELRTDALSDYAYSVEVSEGEVYWPLKGEYWRDELGTYLYTLTRGCAAHRAGSAGF